jgi:hypothetical protein
LDAFQGVHFFSRRRAGQDLSNAQRRRYGALRCGPPRRSSAATDPDQGSPLVTARPASAKPTRRRQARKSRKPEPDDPDAGWEDGKITIGGADLEDLVARLTHRVADHEARLRAIRALIEKVIDGVDAQANLIAARALTDLRRAAGKKSGEVRANKTWRVDARELANNNPELGHAELVRKIQKEVKPPVGHRAVEAFVTNARSGK